jgi:hypothetical protein
MIPQGTPTMKRQNLIKYNHFVANALSLYNVHCLTRVINELAKEGYQFTSELLSSLSPYITSHVKRFGEYRIVFDR